MFPDAMQSLIACAPIRKSIGYTDCIAYLDMHMQWKQQWVFLGATWGNKLDALRLRITCRCVHEIRDLFSPTAVKTADNPDTTWTTPHCSRSSVLLLTGAAISL